MESPSQRLTAWVSGSVQGVGFRWWTKAQALELGLAGSAANRPDGRVEVVAEGPVEALDELLARLREQPSTRGRPGEVVAVGELRAAARGVTGFVER
ncbi:acylphosphatase [Kineococcus sp. R8]|uniref:acylphosphatase n=1 Tax=Kineococcus siccus TaxID=2696567 RepID=UPI001411B548|nr:acylphosphatase [Kineococcus siccus]NAZ82328.1 acylphosphatase [Kineococcus siccus]